MCSASPPPAPDPVATANAQGAANTEAARVQGRMNNPNINGPGGGRTVTWDGDQATINNTLSPDELKIYNQNSANRMGLGGLAGQGIDSLKGLIGKDLDFSSLGAGPGTYNPTGMGASPLDPSSLRGAPGTYQGASGIPDMPQASEAIRQKVIDAQMVRSNSAIDKAQQTKNSELIAAGIRPGTEAYQREMDGFMRQRTDAQQQAEANATNAVQSAFSQDLSRRQQGYQEGITDTNTKFSQGMALRDQGSKEQAQTFGQSGQLAQLLQSQQAQQYGQGMDSRRQAISEILAKRQVPLNEITALMSGSQVSPSGAASGGGSGFAPTSVAPAPIFNAQQQLQNYQTDVYNQQQGAANTNNSAMASAAMMALMYY